MGYDVTIKEKEPAKTNRAHNLLPVPTKNNSSLQQQMDLYTYSNPALSVLVISKAERGMFTDRCGTSCVCSFFYQTLYRYGIILMYKPNL